MADLLNNLKFRNRIIVAWHLNSTGLRFTLRQAQADRNDAFRMEDKTQKINRAFLLFWSDNSLISIDNCQQVTYKDLKINLLKIEKNEKTGRTDQNAENAVFVILSVQNVQKPPSLKLWRSKKEGFGRAIEVRRFARTDCFASHLRYRSGSWFAVTVIDENIYQHFALHHTTVKSILYLWRLIKFSIA